MTQLTATILRGKRKGKVVQIHQFCNDWATLESGGVMALSSLEFGHEGITTIMEAAEKGRVGSMFDLFYNMRHFANTGLMWRSPL